MQRPLLSVGQTIKVRCSKCRKNTDHTLVRLDGQTPVEVTCQVCGHHHKVRAPGVKKRTAVPKGLTLRETEKNEWAALRPNWETAEATDYRMTDAYKAKDLIIHPLFGLGMVLRVAGTQKVEVLFEDGKKMMRSK